MVFKVLAQRRTMPKINMIFRPISLYWQQANHLL